MPEKTNLIKVKFLRHGQPTGRPYTYETPIPVMEGDLVQINEDSIGEGVQTNVPLSEIENFRDKLKCIVGRAKSADEEEVIPENL